MNGKERVLSSLRFQSVDRAPWVPFTGVHCAKVLGIDAETFLKDPRHIVAGVKLAKERYLADGVCSLFDLQIEAEALGCDLKWSKNNPPAVCSHILEKKTLGDLPKMTRESGRIPIAVEATRRLVEELGDDTAIFGLICGPFTLALHLTGASFLTDMIEFPEKAEETLRFATEAARRMSTWLIEAGAHVIAVVDPMTSQISPKHFRKYVAPYLNPIICDVKSQGRLITLFCCGNATKNIELMMMCEPDGIAFDEQVDLLMVKTLGEKYKVCFEGNLPLTTTLLFGSPKECVEDARGRLIVGGRKGFILSPGCDLPFDVPSYNLEAIGRFVVLEEEPLETAGFLSLNEALKRCEEEGATLADVEVYPGEVFIEIVTLDSEGCAPCQYMVETVKKISAQYGQNLKWRETLIKSLAGIKRTKTLGVENLPSLLINNEVVFDNIVPTEEELVKEINKRLV